MIWSNACFSISGCHKYDPCMKSFYSFENDLVGDYRCWFEFLSTPLREISDDILLGGLRDKIKVEIKLFGLRIWRIILKRLRKLRWCLKWFTERFQVHRLIVQVRQILFVHFRVQWAYGSMDGFIAWKDKNYQRLVDIEIQSKLEKQLCFWCDEKYGSNYCCKFRQLQVMLPCEEDRKKGKEFVYI